MKNPHISPTELNITPATTSCGYCTWYALLALMIAIVGVAIGMGRPLLQLLDEIELQQAEWRVLRDEVTGLSDSLAALKSPASDVFESQHLTEEQAQLRRATDAYLRQHTDFLAAIPNSFCPQERETITAKLNALHRTALLLIDESNMVFELLLVGRLKDAAGELTCADRRAWYAVSQLNDIRHTILAICSTHSDAIRARTRELIHWGCGASFVLAGLGVVVTWLSYRTTRRMQALSNYAQATALKLRAILDSAVDPIITINQRGAIIGLNRAAEREFGYSAQELLGQNINRLMPADEAQQHTGHIQRYLQTGEAHVIGRGREVLGKRADGSMFPIELSISEVFHDGQRLFTGVLRNITDQKFVESQFAAARDEADAANRAKSEFLANMSHEIRTPMTAILGYSEMLVGEDGLERAPEDRRHALHTIRRSGQFLLELVNDILDLSRIEAGRLSVQLDECTPTAVVADVANLMQVRADEKQLPLRVSYTSPLPPRFQCDSSRLRQVLLNLVGNAIKFTERGSVEIVCRAVGLDQPTPRLEIDVIDTGIGMSDEQLARLYRPFTQADSSLSRKYGGTGLGLCISKRLIELLGGSIRATSEPGKGTTFKLQLPLVGAPAEGWIDQPAPTAVDPVPQATTVPTRLDSRVLLVEDGPDNQRLISHVLKKAGAEVLIACNGLEGVKAAEQALAEGRPYDVILMDMAMPVMDGYTAASTLRQNGYQRPIVALTAHAMVGDDRKCLDAGCDDYATKPIDRARLLDIVARHTARARELSTAS